MLDLTFIKLLSNNCLIITYVVMSHSDSLVFVLGVGLKNRFTFESQFSLLAIHMDSQISKIKK